MKATAKRLALSALLAIAGVLSTPHASAQIPENSYLRLSEPMNIGGHILQPGVYVISVLPGYGNRNQLQVTNEDHSKIFATVLSIPHQLSPSDTKQLSEFVYYPAIEGSPRALRTWFAANAVSEGGHDIVYPKETAMKLAPAVHEKVIAYDDSTKVEDPKTVELVVVTPANEIKPYMQPLPAPMVASAPAELPQTGSSVPLYAAIGMLLLVAAVATRVIRTV